MRRERMRDSHVCAPGLKHASTASSVRWRSRDGFGARIDRRKRIHEHDLPVETGEVIAEERLDHVGLVALETPREHGAERTARVARRRRRQREKGQQRRSCGVARQQEASGTGSRKRRIVARGFLQIAGEQPRAVERDLLVGGSVGIERGNKFEPRLGSVRALRLPGIGKGAGRPFAEIEIEQG